MTDMWRRQRQREAEREFSPMAAAATKTKSKKKKRRNHIHNRLRGFTGSPNQVPRQGLLCFWLTRKLACVFVGNGGGDGTTILH